MLLRWSSFSVARAFGEWAARFKSRRRIEHIERLAVARLTQRQLAAALYSWRCVTRDATSDRWKADTEQLNSGQTSLGAAQQELEAKQQLVDAMLQRLAAYREGQAVRMLARLMSRNLQACFVLWKFGSKAASTKHRVMTERVYALSARANKKRVGQYFGEWSSYVRIKSDLVAWGRSEQRRMKRRVNRGKMMFAFMRWSSMAEAQVALSAADIRRELRIQRVVTRFTHAASSRAFAAWGQWAATRTSHRLLVRRAAARMCMNGLKFALDQWHLHCILNAKAKGAVNRVLLHFRNGLLARAYTAWCEQVRWRVRSHTLFMRLLSRWSRAAELRCFELWRMGVAREGRAAMEEKGEVRQLHNYYHEQRQRVADLVFDAHVQRQLLSSFAAWRLTALRLRQGPEENWKEASARWAASISGPTAEEQAAASEALVAEQTAHAEAEERANQEAHRREQLSIVLQRAEQRARAMDLTIAEKSQRLAVAEAQLSWLVLGAGEGAGAVSEVDSCSSEYIEDDRAGLLARRSELSQPHRLKDGSGISVQFGDDSLSEELYSDDDDPWMAVVDMATGSPMEEAPRPRSKPSRMRAGR